MDMILLSIVVVAVTGMVLGICIAVAAKKFAVEADLRIDEVTGMLPGANCGGCGFAGCADLAKNIVEGKAPANKCPVCTPEAVAQAWKEIWVDGVLEEKILLHTDKYRASPRKIRQNSAAAPETEAPETEAPTTEAPTTTTPPATEAPETVPPTTAPTEAPAEPAPDAGAEPAA